MADIMAHNNRTDALSRFMTKDIDRYPLTYRMGCLRFLRGMVLGKGVVTFVTETEEDDAPPSSPNTSPVASTHQPSVTEQKAPSKPTVVAYALFSRHGTSPLAQSWRRTYNASYTSTLNRLLLRYEDLYFKTFPFTLSEHTFNHRNFSLVLPTLSTPYDQAIFAEAIECLALYTHHLYQKRGIGSNLMNCAKDKARGEGVPLIVSGSPVGGVAYKRMGFESVGRLDFGEWFDEVEFGGEVMRRWCWEPNEEGGWVERAREAERIKQQEWQGDGQRERAEEGVGQALPTVMAAVKTENK